jgi:hypothetical protein
MINKITQVFFAIIVICIISCTNSKPHNKTTVTGYIVYKEWIKGHKESVAPVRVNQASLLFIGAHAGASHASGGHSSGESAHAGESSHSFSEHSSYVSEEHVSPSGYHYNTSEDEESHYVLNNPAVNPAMRGMIYSHAHSNGWISSEFLIWIANKDGSTKVEVDSVYWNNCSTGQKRTLQIE